ncbi:hypothetical protein BSKO_06366 [Bryopsis sp. KO-2023]|nr:hypothetical protein BSKO_06366 [Bryopsis sp. KO-2023]
MPKASYSARLTNPQRFGSKQERESAFAKNNSILEKRFRLSLAETGASGFLVMFSPDDPKPFVAFDSRLGNVIEEVRTIAQRAWDEHRAGNSQVKSFTKVKVQGKGKKKILSKWVDCMKKYHNAPSFKDTDMWPEEFNFEVDVPYKSPYALSPPEIDRLLDYMAEECPQEVLLHALRTLNMAGLDIKLFEAIVTSRNRGNKTVVEAGVPAEAAVPARADDYLNEIEDFWDKKGIAAEAHINGKRLHLGWLYDCVQSNENISWPKLGQMIGLPSNYERRGTRTKAVYKKWIEPWISSNAAREGNGGEEPGNPGGPGEPGRPGGPGGLRYGTVPWLGGSGSSQAVGQLSDSRIITREPTHVMLQQPIELWGTSSQHVVLDEIASSPRD